MSKRPSNVPYVPWPSFMRDFYWKQGEHVILIGPNGSGKTVVNKHLIEYRKRRNAYMCLFGTKPEDNELEQLEREGFLRVKENRNWSLTSYPWLLLWPDAGFSHHAQQRKVFRDALNGMWRATRWTAILNELRYLTQILKLDKEMQVLYMQARSAKFSISSEVQRPRFVPLEAFSQSTHDFFFACRDDTDLRRLSGIGKLDTKTLRATIASLAQYEVAYGNSITGDICVTKATPFGKRKIERIA